MVTQRKRGFRNRLYSNLKLFLDNHFVARGFYDNVASGELDYNSNNLSQLFPVTNSEYLPADEGPTVQVWQSYRKNWVSESGFVPFASGLTTPTFPSGIYVDGTFFPRHRLDNNSNGSGLALDFRNGRVIVESGITATATVEVPYSYKEVWIDTVARDLISNQAIQIDNTRRIATTNVPSGEIIRLPAIQMEITNQNHTGLELGGGIILYPSMLLHVVAENRYDKDEIIDSLQLTHNKTIQMVDLDSAPEQFDQAGDFGSGYLPYETLYATYKDRNARIESVELIQNDDIAVDGYFTALLRLDFRVDVPEVV